MQKSDFIESGYPCIHYGQVHTRFGTATSNVLSYVSADLAKSLKVVHSGDIIMAVTSEDVDCVCKCTAWVGGCDIVTGGHTAIIRHNQNAKYLSYYFQTPDFAAQKKKLAHGTKVIEVTPSKLAGIKIPLPTLEKQAEVVALLDKFDKLCNDLTSGLPAEIAARKKQYEYYRDKLLNFKRAA